MNNRPVWIALITMGSTWVIAQVLLVRELLVAFHGNELVVGLVLGIWLLAGALGSAGAGWWADRAGNSAIVFIALQAVLAAALPAAVLAARTLRPLAGLLPGELAGPGTMAAVAALVIFPVSAACGGLFAAGCRLLPVADTSPDAPAGVVYVAEAVGSVLGGVLTTYLLIPHLSSLRIALLVSALNLAVAASLARKRTGPRHLLPLLLLLLLALDISVWLSPGADALCRFARRVQWGYRDVLFDRDSAYGNVTVLAEAGQRTFLIDGAPAATAPVPDIAEVEERVHLPLLFHPNPDTVLLLGGGIGGGLSEVLRHPVRRVDYVELDPLLFEAVRAVGSSAMALELDDPRVRVHIADGRRFVQNTPSRYDVILIGHSPPATLALNRFYTRENFEDIKRILNPAGLLAVPCPGSTTYLGDDLRALNAVLGNTLLTAFSHVRIIPGETTFFLASSQPEIETLDAATLSERLQQRNISTRLISPAHLAYKLDVGTASWHTISLQEGPEPKVNTNLMPVALVHTLGHGIALVSPGLHAFFGHLKGITLFEIVTGLAAVVIVLIPILRSRRHPLSAAAPVVLAATGFAGMALNVVLLLAYQTYYGVLYQQIGLFIASAALGIALGGATALRLPRHRNPFIPMAAVEIALILTATLISISLHLLRSAPPMWGQAGLLALSAVSGALVGAQFPMAARIFIRRPERIASPAGALYAADLLGACVGALGVSVVLIPVLGLVRTCILAAAVKSLTLTLLTLSKKP